MTLNLGAHLPLADFGDQQPTAGALCAAVGCAFDERWARFDEALRLVRALVRGEGPLGERLGHEAGRAVPAPAGCCR